MSTFDLNVLSSKEEAKLLELPKFHTVKEQILEFDLNSIFHLTYSFDVLKKVIDKIVLEVDGQNNKVTSIIDKLVQQVNNHENKINLQDKRLDGMGRQFEQKVQNLATLHENSEKQIQNLEQNLKDLRNKMDAFKAYDDSELLKTIDGIHDSIFNQQNKLKDLDSKLINLIQQKSNGSGLDLAELEEMIENLKLDMRDRYVKQQEFADYKQSVNERLSFFDKNLQDVSNQVRLDHEPRLKELEERILKELMEQIQSLNQSMVKQRSDFTQRDNELEGKINFIHNSLINKVDCELFDEEINNIKQALTALSTTNSDDSKPAVTQIIQNTGMSSKDLNKLNTLVTKVGDLEELLNKLFRDMKTLNINDLRENIADVLKKLQLKANSEDLEAIKSQIREEFFQELEKIRNQINYCKLFEPKIEENKDGIQRLLIKIRNIESQLLTLSQEVKDARSSFKQDVQTKDADLSQKHQSYSEEEVGEILKRLLELEEDLKKHKQDYQKNILNLQESLAQKASMQDVEDLEQRILEKMNELFQALIAKFADKADTKKTLKHIESTLKSLYDLVMGMQHNGNTQSNEDDAMFAKKPLGGWSCASCEKNLTNLQGQLAEYNPWSKLPFKDPHERLSKYGAGFSKLLSTMKPDQTQYPGSQNPIATSQLQTSSQNLLSSKGFHHQNQNEDLTLYNSQSIHQESANLRGKTSHQLFKNQSHETILPNLKKEPPQASKYRR